MKSWTGKSALTEFKIYPRNLPIENFSIMSSYYSSPNNNSNNNNNNNTNNSNSNPLSFPSYNASHLSPRIPDKPTNNTQLSNLKHRLPLPQESQHLQSHSHNHHHHHHPQLQPHTNNNNNNNNNHNSINPNLNVGINHNNGNISNSSISSTSSTNSHNVDLNNITILSKNPETKDRPRRERKNRPGQKFGAKKRSWVWTWFVQDSTDPNIAACDCCGKIITRLPSDKGSPKKLSEHLKTHKLDVTSINYSRPVPIDGFGVVHPRETNNNNNQDDEGDEQTDNNDNGDNSIQSQSSSQPLPQQQHQSQSLSPPQQQQQQQQQQLEPQLKAQPQPLQPLQPQLTPHNRLSLSQPQSQSSHLKHVHSHSSTSLSNQASATSIGETLPRPMNMRHSFSSGGEIKGKQEFGYNESNPRRYLSTDFDNTPYTAMKFHKHLLKFLTENKLSINTLKSHSFQQLIYDLRSDSVIDLLELTGLYSSLMEVSRFENQNSSVSMDETNLAQSLAQSVNQKENMN